MSRRFAISSLEEARLYLAHPILGPRLEECAHILTELSPRTAQDIFGSIDAMKLRSSMTLFARAAPESPLFGEVLDRYFDGLADEATDTRLATLAIAAGGTADQLVENPASAGFRQPVGHGATCAPARDAC